MDSVGDTEDFLDWLILAVSAGHDLLDALVQGLDANASASEIAIGPDAWGNTMTALEWAITQGLMRESLHMPTTREDLERVRRVHALGASALAGESVSPELLPLARPCWHVLHAMLTSEQ
jgi:hypothetical protein